MAFPARLPWLALTCLVGACTVGPVAPDLDSGTVDSSVELAPPGTFIDAGSVAFRLWAPHATAVLVEGDFNAGSPTALAPDGTGAFFGWVVGADAGQRYHYLLQESDGGQLLRQDPRALAVDLTSGDGVLYNPSAFAWSASAFQPAPASAQVIYELHLATFNDASGNGAGTWASAAQKLPYLQSLGVNMVEVMPVAQFPGAYSWGYNPTFPFALENRYGTPDDAKAFVDAAHAAGIGVIADIVHNHWGGADLPMWCFDGPCFGTGNGGIYFYTDARRETGFGPRPDYGRVQIRDYIVDNAMMFLGDYRMDGLRWDSVVNIRRAAGVDLPDGWALLQRANATAHAQRPGTVLIAEDLQGDARITATVASGGLGFDSQWDPSFIYPMKAALLPASDASRDMTQVAAAISHGFGGAQSQRVIFTEDHDMVAPQNGPDKGRLPALISPATPGDYFARKRSTLGAALALTSPGIPMLFMGQEFLESTPFPFHPGPAMDWSKVATYSGIVSMYQRMIALRRNLDGTTAGLLGNHLSVFHVNNAAKVIAFHRWDKGGPGDDVVVATNFSNKAFASYIIGLPRSGTWHVRFNADDVAYSPDFKGTPSADVTANAGGRDGQPANGSVALGPYATVILSQ